MHHCCGNPIQEQNIALVIHVIVSANFLTIVKNGDVIGKLNENTKKVCIKEIITDQISNKDCFHYDPKY